MQILLLQAKSAMTEEITAKMEKELSEKTGQKVVIIPTMLEVIKL